MLVFALMIVFAFPAIILATLLLELERAFHWPFFIAEKGGDPLLWQHLFWFFGHPEVYIIFLPAAGMVSMIVPTMAQTRRCVGYRARRAGARRHRLPQLRPVGAPHVHRPGLPRVSHGLFLGRQHGGRHSQRHPGLRLDRDDRAAAGCSCDDARLFILGFLVIFTIGGLTGVMVAMVPFDWQAHDTYFVVAHLHYVLIGGMVFPLFAAFYYWAPTISGSALSERLGRWAFWLMFIGFNVTFFPMHIAGPDGHAAPRLHLSRRLGWDVLNLHLDGGRIHDRRRRSVFLVDLAANFRRRSGQCRQSSGMPGRSSGCRAAIYGTRSIPIVNSREPLWDQPALAEDADKGRYYLPGAPTGGRETIVTSPDRCRSAICAAGAGQNWLVPRRCVYRRVLPAADRQGWCCWRWRAAFSLWSCIVAWMWQTDPGENHSPVNIGGGIKLPVYMTGASSHSWWAMVILLLVAASIFIALVFSYLYLWTASPQVWPGASGQAMAELRWPFASALAFIVSSAAIACAGSMLRRWGASRQLRLVLLFACAALAAALLLEFQGQWQSGLRPTASSYGALVYTVFTPEAQLAAAALIMGFYTVARSWTGLLTPVRRATYDNTMLFWHYTVGQGLLSLLIVHGFPRIAG